jgi:hypothetical protein
MQIEIFWIQEVGLLNSFKISGWCKYFNTIFTTLLFFLGSWYVFVKFTVNYEYLIFSNNVGSIYT